MTDTYIAAIGATDDAAAVTGNGSVVALLKGLRSLLGGGGGSLNVGGFTSPARVTITRPTGSVVYAAGDAWSDDSATPPNVTAGRANGGTGVITGMQAITDAHQPTLPAFQVMLFDTTFTALADNQPVNMTDGEVARFVGAFEVTTGDWIATNSATGTSGNAVAHVPPNAANPAFACLAASQLLYPVVRMTNAYVPVSQEQLTLIFDVLQD